MTDYRHRCPYCKRLLKMELCKSKTSYIGYTFKIVKGVTK